MYDEQTDLTISQSISSPQNPLLYLLIEKFLQNQGFSSEFLSHYRNFIQSQKLLTPIIKVTGNSDPATFTEYQYQLSALQNHSEHQQSLEKIFTQFSHYTSKNSQTIKDTQSLLETSYKNFLSYSHHLEQLNLPISRRDSIKKTKIKAKNQQTDPCPLKKHYFCYFQRLKTFLGHAHSPNSGIVYHENDEPYIPVYDIRYDQSGKLIFTGDGEGLLKIWSALTGLLLSNLKGHSKQLTNIEVSPCNKYLASGSIDGTVRVWDFYIGKSIAVFKQNEEEPISCLDWHWHEKTLYLVTGSDKGFVYIYKEQDFKDNNGQLRIDQPCIKLNFKTSNVQLLKDDNVVQKNEIYCLIIHPDGYIVASCEFGEIVIWGKTHQIATENLRSNQNYIIWKEHYQFVVSIRFNKQGNKLISASRDGTSKIWEFKSTSVEQNRHAKSFITFQLNEAQLLQDTSHVKRNQKLYFASNCEAAVFSCNGKYAISTFVKVPKKNNDDYIQEFTYVLVYNVNQHKLLREDSPIKLNDSALVMETHPIREDIIMLGEYSTGIITIWDIEEGIALNYFVEKGYSINYPNTECPIVDAKFSPDGLQLTVTTYFGQISIYGFENCDFYKQCPNEQFFSGDYEPFTLSEDLRVMSTDINDVEIFEMDRGRICNYSLIPHTFMYHNNLEILRQRNYFSFPNQQFYQTEQEIAQLSNIYNQNYFSNYNGEQDEKEFYQNCLQQKQDYEKKNQIFQKFLLQEEKEKKEYLINSSNLLKKRCKRFLNSHSIDSSFINLQEINKQILKERQFSIESHNNENSQNVINSQQNSQQQNQINSNRRIQNRRLIRLNRGNQVNNNNNQNEIILENIENNNLDLQSSLPLNARQRREREIQQWNQLQKEQYEQFIAYEDPNDQDWGDGIKNQIKTSSKNKITRSNRRQQEEIKIEQNSESEIVLDQNFDYKEDFDQSEEDDNDDDGSSLVDEFNEDFDQQLTKRNNHQNYQRNTRNRGKRLKKFGQFIEDIDDENFDENIEDDNENDSQHRPSSRRQQRLVRRSNNRDYFELTQQNVNRNKRRNPFSQEYDEHSFLNNNNNNLSSRIGTRNKKLKIDDDEEDQFISNEIQQAQRQKIENQICFRCTLDQANKKCLLCENYYHQTCAKMRGVQKEHRFYCFDCYGRKYYNKMSVESLGINNKVFTKLLNRNYLQQSSQDQEHYYSPQIGDSVYYIFQAHEEFTSENFEIFNHKLLQDSVEQGQNAYLPFLNHMELFHEILELKITDLKYEFSLYHNSKLYEKYLDKYTQIQLILTLQHEQLTQIKFNVVYLVNFIKPETNFLIQKQKFDNLYQNIFSIKQFDTHYLIDSQGIKKEIQITEISAKEECFPTSFYLRIIYRFMEDDKYKLRHQSETNQRISFWDLFNIYEIKQEKIEYLQDQTNKSCFSNEEIQQLLKLIEIIEKQRNDSENFLQPVDIKIWKNYLYCIQIPSDISKIKERLQNFYYRSQKSLEKDVCLIRENAFRFNDPQSQICIDADTLCQSLQSIINNYKNYDEVLPTLFISKKAYQNYLQQQIKSLGIQQETRTTRRSLRTTTQQNENIDYQNLSQQEQLDSETKQFNQQEQLSNKIKLQSSIIFTNRNSNIIEENSNQEEQNNDQFILNGIRSTRARKKVNYNENQIFNQIIGQTQNDSNNQENGNQIKLKKLKNQIYYQGDSNSDHQDSHQNNNNNNDQQFQNNEQLDSFSEEIMPKSKRRGLVQQQQNQQNQNQQSAINIQIQDENQKNQVNSSKQPIIQENYQVSNNDISFDSKQNSNNNNNNKRQAQNDQELQEELQFEENFNKRKTRHVRVNYNENDIFNQQLQQQDKNRRILIRRNNK